MARTTHFEIPKPDEETKVKDEFYRLQEAWDLVDTILKALADNVADRAPADHGHPMSAIVGLVDALAGKMPATAAFKLDDLTDVAGMTAAPAGYIMVKGAGGVFGPSSALAALGQHGHLMSEITGLAQALSDRVLASALKDAAYKNTGTAAGTVAAGDDTRIVNAIQSAKAATITDLDTTPDKTFFFGFANTATGAPASTAGYDATGIQISAAGQIDQIVIVGTPTVTAGAASGIYWRCKDNTTWSQWYRLPALTDAQYTELVAGIISKADAEAGLSTIAEKWSAERVAQAIAALAPKPVYQDVTASRTHTTVYQNTTGKPITVQMALTLTASSSTGNSSAAALETSPDNSTWHQNAGDAAIGGLSAANKKTAFEALVPNGFYYRLTRAVAGSATYTINRWGEVR